MPLSVEYVVERMGALLRQERLSRNESQEIFAARLAIHRNTLIKMESGHPKTSIETWVRVLRQMELDRKILELMGTAHTEPPARVRADRRRKTDEPEEAEVSCSM